MQTTTGYNKKGTVESQHYSPRSYIVNSDGHTYRRNRRHLLVTPNLHEPLYNQPDPPIRYPESPRPQPPVVPPKTPIRSPEPQRPQSPVLEAPQLRRSTRHSKPPDKLDL